jgi:predicted house-cleaning noncanonical NTP pyrophosphatase (MazG superfamily)
MKTFKMNKLVRDKVVDVMKGQNKIVETRVLDDREFVAELKVKLMEELDELNEVDFGDKDHFKNELADIQLLIDYLLKSNNISKEELDEFQKEKLAKVGGFDKRIFVGKVDLQDDDEWVEYYRKKGFEEVKER